MTDENKPSIVRMIVSAATVVFMLAALWFGASMAGYYAYAPAPKPPLSMAAYSLVGFPQKCENRRVLRVIAATNDVAAWHPVLGADFFRDNEPVSWLMSEKYDLSLYKQSDGKLQVGLAETGPGRYKEADIAPVCRWYIEISHARLVKALTPPEPPLSPF